MFYIIFDHNNKIVSWQCKQEKFSEIKSEGGLIKETNQNRQIIILFEFIYTTLFHIKMFHIITNCQPRLSKIRITHRTFFFQDYIKKNKEF